MDPDTAWRTLCDWQNETEDRADAAAAIVEWVDKGGALPEGMSKLTVLSTAATVLAHVWSTR